MEMLSIINRSLQAWLRQKLPIETLRLSFSRPMFIRASIGDWVATAVALKVKNLEVKCSKCEIAIEIPSSALSASSIVVLNLFDCKVDTSGSDGVDLPVL
ncbi:hypothetical protein Droror1_Dr00009868 [Drosera rotundifolia]